QLDSFSKQLTELTKINEEKLEKMRDTVDNRLKIIQDRNSKELEKMREIVDEKLQSTLEKRLGESFKQVSNQLDLVAKGLGEMRTLASGVGDLKNLLSNIKVRGTWGEIQLGALLEEILTTDQYEHNVKIKRNTTVEYAIKLPGKEENSKLYIPIDSKFPMEDYQRLVSALEIGDQEGIKKSRKQLEDRIKSEAKKIKDKYISPPITTNFAILFLPIEGLYLEVLRLPVSDFIQREYNIMITGPTTLAALLNSLQMGFRTLAIEKRSSEVWKLLSAIKTEFGKFGELLETTQKKIQVVSNSIEKAAQKSRKIESKLKKVEELPKSDADKLLALDEPSEIDDEPEETTDEN
ncbi:DNA recombination protein RmuC, partial [Candidatus Dependentiae bacterium]|nr:DNA recombination protein RmuC [Candidatus Dependentiae bacterium]